MELRNYANECYMRVRRNDLRKDIENGYISHEQANQYLAEYAYELKYPDKKPDKTVIQFITDAITSVDRKNSDDVLYDFFHAGYCYYFALMLAFMMIFTMKQHQKNWNLRGQTQSLE